MKWQTKPNQFSIVRSEFHKAKVVDAIKIDAKDKSISYIKIEDCIEYIQKSLDFFNYQAIQLSDELDFLIVGVDDDLKNRQSFTLAINNLTYHGDAMVIRVPMSGNLQKLKNTKSPLARIKGIVKFEF